MIAPSCPEWGGAYAKQGDISRHMLSRAEVSGYKERNVKM
jgi:hypothetical protein